MARKIQTLLIDDLDGGEAAGTVRFGLDGTNYEIDLSAAHGDELRRALGQYVAHARRTGGPARSAARSSRGGDTADTAKVRAWAKDQGIEIKDRGQDSDGIQALTRDGSAAPSAATRGVISKMKTALRAQEHIFPA